eukprot:s2481_g5.t1
MPVTHRLTCKTKLPKSTVRFQPGLRKAALKDGLCPKARRPFAIYLSENYQLKRGQGSKDEHAREMKRVGAQWKRLSAAKKATYHARSAEEVRQQHIAMSAAGVFCKQLPQMPCQTDEAKAPLCSQQVTVALQGAFRLQQKLGEGFYGKVFEAFCKSTGKVVVLKLFSGRHSEANLLRETGWLKLLVSELGHHYHTYFCSVFASDPAVEPCPWFSMEHGGQSLDRILKTHDLFKDERMELLACQLSCALRLLHSRHICHLDIKPGNLLWLSETRSLKLTDCGLMEFTSVRDKKDTHFTMYVTEGYRPPELYVNEIDRSLLTPAIDIFSAGSTLYEACVGKNLFRPLGKLGSIKDSVSQWCMLCQDVQATKVRAIPLPVARARAPAPQEILSCRLSEAGLWKDRIRAACAAAPNRRALPA